MNKTYTSTELKEQALIKAEVLKLIREYPSCVFLVKKDRDYDWYEIVFSDWGMFKEDEMFEDDKARMREKMKKSKIIVVFCYSSDPSAIKGDWVFTKK